MATMVAIVGEQPMPILLPARRLNPEATLLICSDMTEPVAKRLAKLIPNSQIKKSKASAYALQQYTDEIQALVQGQKDLIFNLTGGTKIMALAAFAVATQTASPFVYYESEKHKSVLHQYHFDNGLPTLSESLSLPGLISAADYLNAHLPAFHEDGFSKAEGGFFEKAVYDALRLDPQYEVLAGVRPEGVANQIEIDLVVRSGNLVGIMEVKQGDAEGKGPKAGLDQLAMAGGRDYLGTYTEKFLVTARSLIGQANRVKILAAERKIHVVEIPDYQIGKPLSKSSTDKLQRVVREKLLGIVAR
jgi:hypothetical protein